ncbi:MAG: PKD domain-containing protein, partial [Flavobacteriales bacterium]|nr:PKD domain-containing protein [Flavobacteriales bacterium]
DLDSGVTLVLNSTNQGLCIPEFDTLYIIWTVDPTVNAGPDLSDCVDTSGIPLAGVVGGGTTTGMWETLGSGIFNDSVDLNTNYHPSLADEAAITVQIVLHATNGCRPESDTLIAATRPTPIAGIDHSKTCNSLLVTFMDTSTTTSGSITQWSWNFGDLTTSADTSNLQNPTYLYPDSGTYTAQLIITTDQSCTDATSTQFEFGSLVSYFGATGNCQRDPFDFEDSSYATITDPIVSWSWDFGDFTTSTEQSPAHTYASEGTYQVILTVQTGAGCTDSDTSSSVLVNPNPTAGFTFSAEFPTILEEVEFLDASIGADQWLWDFGDGDPFSQTQNPKHTYLDVGLMQVTQVVTNSITLCRDSLTMGYRIANIYPPAVPRSFSPNGDGQNDLLYARGGPFEILNMKVYNEWGELIFETDDPLEPWDGTKNGFEQPVGVYVWVVVATTLNGFSFEDAGDVSLIR